MKNIKEKVWEEIKFKFGYRDDFDYDDEEVGFAVKITLTEVVKMIDEKINVIEEHKKNMIKGENYKALCTALENRIFTLRELKRTIKVHNR